MADEVREKCAVAGVLLEDGDPNDASAYVQRILFNLQHRGDEATGIASKNPRGPLNVHQGNGYVRDVYTEKAIKQLKGSIACGHNMYSTSYSANSKGRHLQPIYDRATGVAFAHNGNLTKTDALKKYLKQHNILTDHLNDSEMIGHSLAQMVRAGQDLPSAVESVFPMLTGAFSCVAIHDGMMVAFRDGFGIRPLALGHFNNSWVISSETCGLDAINAKYDREIEPGEMVVITRDGVKSRQLTKPQYKLDLFEFVYFARHDSYLYGQSVNEVRRRAGEQLAREHGPIHEDTDNIIVVPVPDTSIPIAEGYSAALRLRQVQAIIKNRYISARQFMQPTPDMRERLSRQKHNIIREAVEGKDVILVDDSIVRFNTLPNLIKRLDSLGVKSISVLIGSPPVRFPDFYGIDTPSQKELAAANMTIEQMCANIKAQYPSFKYLGYLPLDRLIAATGKSKDMFNISCFTGEYPIDIGANMKDIQQPVSLEYVEPAVDKAFHKSSLRRQIKQAELELSRKS